VSTLRIRFFGSLDLERDGQALGRFPSRKVRDLFAYLTLNRETAHAREHLAGLFWGDSDDEKARHSLNTALWRLNGVLTDGVGDRGRAQLRITPQEIGFNPAADFWLDIAEFESRCALASNCSTPDQQAALYSQAITFYTADLLTDCYEEWCIQERERLQCMYLRTLGELLKYHSRRGSNEAAIDCARRILAVDALREEVHRELIQLYLTTGQTASALRQYRVCEELLQRELAVSPMPETQVLLVQILGANQLRPVRDTRSLSGLESMSTALVEIARELAASMALVQQAIASFDQAQARLQELASMPHVEAGLQPVALTTSPFGRARAGDRRWAGEIRTAV
jgi:DNA-binding SARP family transcriptional activator